MRQIKKIVELIKDLLFPRFCLSCQKEGEWLCGRCLENLKKEIEPQFFCPHCYQDNKDGWACPGCRPFSFLDRAISLASYDQVIIAKMIQLLKYDYIEEMADVFAKLIEPTQDCHSRESGNPERFKLLLDPRFRGDDSAGFSILPIPLHRRRYLERGFNQAVLLAQVWAKHLGLPLLKDVLVRGRPTNTQVGLGREDRRQNLLGAFKLKKPLPSQKVILVDDVFTTGSTLQEAARILKEGGVREVWGLTVARER